MNYIFSSAIALLVLSLTSCSETRYETSEFFQKKTGLPICKGAKIINRRIGDHDYKTDFTYSVEIELDKECISRLQFEILDRLGVNCDLSDNCLLMDNNIWAYDIERLSNESLIFTLVAT